MIMPVGTSADRPPPAPPRPASPAKRVAALAGLLIVVLVLVAIALVFAGGPRTSSPADVSSSGSQSQPVPPPATAASVAPAPAPAGQLRFVDDSHALPNPVQGDAGTALDAQHGVVAGGVDANGHLSDQVVELSPQASRLLAPLPVPVRDASAAAIAGTAYLFGGRDSAGAGRGAILQMGPSGGAQQVGRLPQATWGAAAVTIGGTAYVVGGNAGGRSLTSVVAWRPGDNARIVAQLPKGLSYPAVGVIGGQVIIAGGTSDRGPSRAVYGFDPSSGQVSGILALPHPLTHAAGAALDGRLYLLGGVRSVGGTQTDETLAYDPTSTTVSSAGRLPEPLSDRLLLAGGVNDAGRVSGRLISGAR